MFGSQGYASASRRYAAIDTGSKVEGANPHQLVKILFDELLVAMDATTIALRMGDRAKMIDKQTRALSILHALETSLDFQKGGEIAVNLAVIYREARRRLIAATAENDVEKATFAHSIVSDIAGAWAQIG